MYSIQAKHFTALCFSVLALFNLKLSVSKFPGQEFFYKNFVQNKSKPENYSYMYQTRL